tara:strand:- start:487 stop:1095 length:609 start_codon:yes stop_codon:yes gene_type:complete
MYSSQYTESFDWLETNCELIGTGANKRVYYNNKNDIVFKLFKDKDILYGELVDRYRILTDKKINFFVPKSKYINDFVFVSQYANPIKVTNEYKVNNVPDSDEWADCNWDIYNKKIKLLNKDPIKHSCCCDCCKELKCKNNWDIVCNKTQEQGVTSLYNWGIRKNKILLLDFEMLNMERTVSYLLEPGNAEKFQRSLNIYRYY